MCFTNVIALYERGESAKTLFIHLIVSHSEEQGEEHFKFNPLKTLLKLERVQTLNKVQDNYPGYNVNSEYSHSV